jgi:hypothetical protein
MESEVSASDWSKGISLSILASIIGGASKLAIRKSWLIEEEQKRHLIEVANENEDEEPDAMAEQDPLHQSHSHLAHDNDDEQDTHLEGETIAVAEQIQPRQVQVQEVDVLSQLNRQNSSHDEDTPSLRFRRPLSLSRSTSYDSVNVDDVDDVDEDVSDDDVSLRGTKRKQMVLALCLRGSGMVGMTLLNPLACVLAMNYASPSILAPFSGLTLVWIVLLSNPIIGEQPTVPQIMAACLIVFGEVIVGIFGDHTNDEGVTVEDVVRTVFQIFYGVSAGRLLNCNLYEAPSKRFSLLSLFSTLRSVNLISALHFSFTLPA